MPDIFAEVLAEHAPNARSAVIAELAIEPPAERPSDASALDKKVHVLPDCNPGEFDGLVEAQARGWAPAVRGVHDLELERASKPPVINVTIASPDGTPATDGHFRVDTGPQSVQYVDGPAPEPEDPAQLTRLLASQLAGYPGGEEVQEVEIP